MAARHQGKDILVPTAPELVRCQGQDSFRRTAICTHMSFAGQQAWSQEAEGVPTQPRLQGEDGCPVRALPIGDNARSSSEGSSCDPGVRPRNLGVYGEF